MTGSTILIGDDGLPIAAIDLDQIDAAATLLAYRLAVVCDSPEEVTEVLTAALKEHGPIFGQVAAGALRNVVEHVLSPVLAVTDRLEESGFLLADLRAGLADACAGAEATLGGGSR